MKVTRALWSCVVVLSLAAVLGVSGSFSSGEEPAPVVAYGNTSEGEVWVSVEIARHRTGESFFPLIITVLNKAKKAAELDRGSFRIFGARAETILLGGIKEVRSGYGKFRLDWSAAQGVGLPLGTKLKRGRRMRSNFFPIVTIGSSVKIDHVYLPRGHWSVDIFYFPWPSGLKEGFEVTLEVQADRWEAPVSVPFRL